MSFAYSMSACMLTYYSFVFKQKLDAENVFNFHFHNGFNLLQLTLPTIILGIISTFLIAIPVCVLLVWNKHRQYGHIPGPKRTSFFCGNISELTKVGGR